MKRHALIFWSAILLAVFGLVSGLAAEGLYSLRGFVIPVLLFLVLYLLYKFPPRRYAASGRRSRIKVKPSQKTMAKVAGMRKSQPPAGKRKTYPFRVIEGSKGKNGEEQLPKYH
ncbi:hypothetical protein G5B47_04380 [Paenibacillus sp. 7124]|uniref:DUF2207 domain-containing protein n=1 Tax=Paenibacillus apii TaxID=1850370 RepID=A0A6M1PEN3_9BACL|nr:hypothetical protein [Paenibacillus apii]NGM81646.1 hypothetical protein [Paenibacillus apii]NJJ41480.1 hypothetical protein [Paenibacillus apii]